jgi:hypothetical protein
MIVEMAAKAASRSRICRMGRFLWILPRSD